MAAMELPGELQRAVDFHGHLCPGLVIGYRAAMAAREALGLTRSQDEEVVVTAENNSCSVDAMQVLLGATFGKGNLVWLDHGKQVFTVSDRGRGRAVRLSFVGDGLKTRLADGRADREGFIAALLTRPLAEVYRVEEVEASPPPLARIEASLRCAVCGEATQESRTVKVGERVLCRPCAAKEGR